MAKPVSRPRVIIADDHEIFIEGLRSILEPEFEVVAVAFDGHAAAEAAANCQPDLVLLEVALPVLNGIEACRRIVKHAPGAKIVFISMHADQDYVGEALGAGASGYLLKCCSVTEIMSAVREVVSGERYVTPLLDGHELGSLAQTADLTGRQREVLQLVAEGLALKQIGEALQISVKTVEFHKAQIMDRLGLRSTAELTRYAIQHGILPVERPGTGKPKMKP